MKFSELVRLVENEGFRLVEEKGSVRYYGKPGVPRLIRTDYHGSKEVVCETAPIGYSIGEPQKNDPSDTGSWLFSFKGGM
jgi:predicted RNA binding protein YcfA (HicA-like mRNA interferase family)